MSTEIAVVEIEITQETAPAIYQGKGLDQFFEKIKEATNEICDVTTAAGRKRIASQSFKISRSKTAVVAPGREYLKTIKALPKLIEQELREFENKCDALRDEKRKPLDDWEAEQKAIEDKRQADEQAAKDAAQLEADHEIALLMDDAFNRAAEDARKAAEQAQRERDNQAKEVKRLADEKAAREADTAHKAKINRAAVAAMIELLMQRRIIRTISCQRRRVRVWQAQTKKDVSK